MRPYGIRKFVMRKETRRNGVENENEKQRVMDRSIYDSMHDLVRPCLCCAYRYCAVYIALQLYDIFGARVSGDKKFCYYFFG